MTAVEVRVDDRVILISAATACAAYLLIQWHRSQFVRRRRETTCEVEGQARAPSDDAANSEAAWVSRLLEQGFTRGSDDEPFADLPLVEAIAEANASFAPQLALQVERHCAALTDFNGEHGETVALHLGCGVGSMAIALADAFQRVVAVEASQLCIDAAKALQSQGCLSYRSLTPDGATGARRMAQLPPEVDAGRISYVRAEPEAFVAEVDPASADAVVMVGLLQRLAQPAAFLEAVAPLLRPQGILAIGTDYGWDPQITDCSEWLMPLGGGKESSNGAGQRPHELASIVESLGFVLAAELELPSAMRRDGPRRWHVSVQHCTIWRQQL